MKTVKTALSLLLTLCLLLSFGTAAFADGEGDQQPTTDPAPASAPAAEAAPAAEVKTAPVAAVGGVAGVNDASDDAKAGGTVGNCYNTGDVKTPDAEPAAASAHSATTYLIKDEDNDTISITNPKISGFVNGDTINEIDLYKSFDNGDTIYVNGQEFCTGGAEMRNPTTVVVEGNITRNDKGTALSVWTNDTQSIDLTVNGNVTSTESLSSALTICNSGSGDVDVTVNGDVTSMGQSIVIFAADNSVDITVGTADKGGTITGKVILPSGVNAGNTSITAWKVDKDIQAIDDSVIQSVIHYIVRLVQPDPDSNDSDVLSISATKANGDDLGKDKSGTMDVAQQGDTIKLNVNTAAGEGYVVKAYNGNEEIKPDADGNFFYDVKLGGGVLLKAIRSLIKPEPNPEPKPAVSMVDLSAASVQCTFDLAGGTLDGETGKVTKWFVPGTTVKLPAAPVKDGFTFAGWQTVVNGEKAVFQAGEKFAVTGAQSFTALWEAV